MTGRNKLLEIPDQKDQITLTFAACIIFSFLASIYLLLKFKIGFHPPPRIPFPRADEIIRNFKLFYDGHPVGYTLILRGAAIFSLMASFFLSFGKLLLDSLFNFKDRNTFNAVSFMEIISLRYICGSLAASILWLILGLFGFLNMSCALAVGLTGLSLFFYQGIKSLRNSSAAGPKMAARCLGMPIPEKIMSFLILAILFLFSACAFVIPEHGDSLLHHAALPNYYINEGRIIPNPHDYYSYFTQNTEMNVMWALLLKSEFAAVLLTWGFLASFVFFAWGYLGRRTDNFIGLTAAAVLISNPLVGYASLIIKPDLPSSLMIFAHYCCLIECFDGIFSKNKPFSKAECIGFILLAGILAGGAAGHKQNALYVILFSSFAIFLHPKIRILAPFWLIGVALPLAPWLIKNIYFVGNPVFPYLGRLFGGDTSEMFYQNSLRYISVATVGWTGVKNYIWGLLTGVNLPDVPGLGAPMLFMPLIIFLFRKPFSMGVSIATGTAVITSLFMHTWLEPRFNIGSYMFFILVPLSLTWHHLKILNPSKIIHRLVFLSIIFSVFILFRLTSIPLTLHASLMHMVSGNGPQNYGMNDSMDPYDSRWLIHIVNSRTPNGDAVLFTGPLFNYGIHRKTFYSSSWNKDIFVEIAKKAHDSAGIAQQLEALGIKHIIISSSFYSYFIRHSYPDYGLSQGDMQKISEFFKDSMQLRHITPDKALRWYSIKLSDESFPISLSRDDAEAFPSMYFFETLLQSKIGNHDTATLMIQEALSAPMSKESKNRFADLLSIKENPEQ